MSSKSDICKTRFQAAKAWSIEPYNEQGYDENVLKRPAKSNMSSGVAYSHKSNHDLYKSTKANKILKICVQILEIGSFLIKNEF